MTCFLPSTGVELVIRVFEDPLVHPSVAPRAPSIPTPSTLHPLPTIIETTKESLSKAGEAGVPCLSDRGSDDCDDGDIGVWLWESVQVLPAPTDGEDFYSTLPTPRFRGDHEAKAPWTLKLNKPSISRHSRTNIPVTADQSRTTTTSASTATFHNAPAVRPAGNFDIRELKPQPDLVLLP
ncbi:hypothetical protein OJAV_G00217150 [Oryzias javanicus]|uniref:Uncharacterized protein n=1 Tax=Oryzias javanicus TaxID=123683 RepID=A0A437C4I8_ORYJA|nr:hypothetical protein OJAV_G00217150 [Oryzias javanicus]